MNKVTKTLIIAFIIFISYDCTAQHGFFSKLYFPTDLGMNIPIKNKRLESGILISSGLEYRFKVEHGIFLRFNYDNLTNSYSIAINGVTNAQKSKLNSNLF